MTLRQLNHMPVVWEYQDSVLASEIQCFQNGTGAILVRGCLEMRWTTF